MEFEHQQTNSKAGAVLRGRQKAKENKQDQYTVTCITGAQQNTETKFMGTSLAKRLQG